jgi:hypothetical protein
MGHEKGKPSRFRPAGRDGIRGRLYELCDRQGYLSYEKVSKCVLRIEL